MKQLRSKKQIIDCLHEAGLSLWDKETNSDVTSVGLDIFIDLLTKEKSEEDFLQSVEAARFAKTIDDFSIENTDEEKIFEFYAQHRNEISNNKEKAKVFQKKFKIEDFDAFKRSFKKRKWYTQDFYNDEMRLEILGEQKYKCALCNNTIDSISPHLHHIDYDKENCSRENLVFVCPRCHGKTNSNRDFWKNMLTERQNEFIKNKE